MSALALLYIISRIAEERGGRTLSVRELFDHLYELWEKKQYALYSDYHQVLNVLDFLESLGLIEIEGEGGEARLRITDKGYKEVEKVSPFMRERIPLV